MLGVRLVCIVHGLLMNAGLLRIGRYDGSHPGGETRVRESAHTAAPRLTSRDRLCHSSRDILSLFSCRVTLQNKYLSRMSYSLIQRVL